MKTFKTQAAQGDMLLTKISKLPSNVTKTEAVDSKFILAHSETGHNHIVKQQKGITFYSNDNDPFIAYLVVDNTKCLVEHERSFDTHENISLKDGIYEIRIQREYTPEGFRRAKD
jgi:hypothetical protein